MKNLAETLTSGRASELDYLPLEAQAECLDRFEFLLSCSEDELQGAAEFLALSLEQEDH